MNRRLKLISWVKGQHEGQLIKETNAPYFDHLLAVANGVADAAPLTYEIGLCHDLLEKTSVTPSLLLGQLEFYGYNSNESKHISSCVEELTRQFTKAVNPLPKRERKALEDERLLKSVQTHKRLNMLIFLITRIGWYYMTVIMQQIIFKASFI
jgi:(p)ppGpp synthase/HD superfamily hydrolase